MLFRRNKVSDLERRLAELEKRTADLERVAPSEFSLTHYNVLADQYASNLQPWFLYGGDVTDDERDQLLQKFYERDADGVLVNKGWPNWAGLLSPERQAAIEAQDANNFAWGPRSIKLWEELEAANSDLITLAECDHYEDFWQGRLNAAGYGSVWRQRPREASRDGCLIGWRDATFELIAEGGCAVGDSFGEQQQGRLDRTLLLALLRFRRCPSERVLIATTHLARNPEKREQDLRRGYQYGLLFRELLAFAQAHDAVDVPCIITGDLNAQSVDDLSGLTKAVAIACGGVEEVHPIISCVQDAPTPPTTKTDARCFRIDYVLYQSTKLRLIKVGAIPPLLEPMPNERMPSDHVPVSVKFAFRSPHSQLEADARQWLNAMSDARSVRPLSAAELRRAFAFFDKDGSEIITPIELAAGMQSLNYGASSNLSAQRVREAVREAASITSDGLLDDDEDALAPDAGGCGGGSDAAPIRYDEFARAYMRRAYFAESSSFIQLRIAFTAFDMDGDGVLTVSEFEDAMKRVAPQEIDEVAMQQLIRELDQNGDKIITVEEWLDFCVKGLAKIAGSDGNLWRKAF